MKKLLMLAALVLAITGGLRAQTLDEMLSARPAVDCSDIAYNSSVYYVKYMTEGKLDSVHVILDYWEEKCGVREPVYRARVLTALHEGTFNDVYFSESPFWYVFNYENRMAMMRAGNYFNYDNDKAQYGYLRPGDEFDEYTMWLGGEMMKKYEPGSAEYLMAEFYSGEGNADMFLDKLQTGEYSGTAPGREYRRLVDEALDDSDWHYAFMGGAWVPSGDLAELGIHPEVGFAMGGKFKRMNIDLFMNFKFGKPKNPYMAKRDGEWEMTDHFFGGYIGLEAGYDILQTRKHEVQIGGGIAFDGIDVLGEDKENDIKGVSANALNLNLGLGYRFYTSRNFYVGLRARYNFVDYSRSGNIRLGGNVVTIGLQIGWLHNLFKQYRLDMLRYKHRK